MPIAAILLTLADASEGSVRQRLAADPRLRVGAPVGDRLPVAIDTPTGADGEALLEELSVVEGVTGVEVVAVDFSEDDLP